MPRFEFKEGSSNKFWDITRDGAVLTTRWGRIGTQGQEKVQTFSHEYEARTAYTKQVQEKEKKGYTPVKPGASAPKPKAHPELEAAILRAPDEADGYLVYGDWLQSQGDPRGELIALQHAQLRAKGAKAPALKRQVSKLLQTHQDSLLGEDLASLIGGGMLTVEWYLGFIRRARLGADPEGEEAEIDVREGLQKLLAHPSARFLQVLTLGLADNDGENEYGDHIKVIAKAAPGALHTLFIGDFEYPDESEISWAELGNVAPLYKALPQLRSLQLRGAGLGLGTIDLPELREFTVETGGLPLAAVKSITTAKWPKLERLTVWFGSRHYGARGNEKTLEPLLEARGLPKLEHLGLCNAEFTDALCAVLPKSKVLKQLRTLDLSRGCMTDEGAAVLAAHAHAFKHLEHIDVAENLLSSQGTKLLAKLGPAVDTGHQRNDGARYVAVGE
jgi:uncharacterized protein (TIGR02996 family)